MSGKKVYGDYQTPIDFAEKVCFYLKNELKINPDVVLEPTCGIGNFLKAGLIFNANEYWGVEINAEYCKECREEIKDERVKIVNADFFTFSFNTLFKDKSNILIIGNPPWVTNSTLSIFDSDNLPLKTNFKELKGIDAITGASNFDICEYIILHLINEYRNSNTTIAMLCKTSVARNIFKELKRNRVNFCACDLLEFDASKIFGINVSACVLIVRLSKETISPDFCNIYSLENLSKVKSTFGYSNGHLYSNLNVHTDDFDGNCCFTWRQGVKHDCSKIMELTINNGVFQNGMKEEIDIESDFVFPLVKSSMFKFPVINTFCKYVIVTQKKAKEETKHLKNDAPKTWDYLNQNIDFFNNRKSSIYYNAPKFSMFGVGDYSYSNYKVGVSGFYKKPLFSVIFSNDGKPVMTDDTSYFICFDNYESAYVAMLLLNSKRVQDFLTNIAFLDAKRPYTKKVLERIDFGKITKIVRFDELVSTEQNLKLIPYITVDMYENFKDIIELGQIRFI